MRRGIEDWALRYLATQIPALQRMQFRSHVLDAIQADPDLSADDYGEVADLTHGFIPDGHIVNTERREILCVEVEDTSTLTRDKLHNYCYLWLILDCIGWTFGLFTTDRYGRELKSIDLFTFYYYVCAKEKTA